MKIGDEVCEKDEVWYGGLSKTSLDDLDRAFKRLSEKIGDLPIKSFERRHGRALYNQFRKELTISAAEKTWKYLRKLFSYAREIGVLEVIPIDEMKIERPKERTQVWSTDEIERFIKAAMKGGIALGGHGSKVPIEPRPSVALGVSIAYDTSLPQGDVLRLKWSQWDGQGFEVEQQKKRGIKIVYVMVSDATRKMLNNLDQTSPYIVVSEKTGRPYLDDPNNHSHTQRTVFSRLVANFRKRLGINGRHFHDLRRTALTEMGKTGATGAEIVSFSGHSLKSKVLDNYIKPDKRAAKLAHDKRWKNKA